MTILKVETTNLPVNLIQCKNNIVFSNASDTKNPTLHATFFIFIRLWCIHSKAPSYPFTIMFNNKSKYEHLEAATKGMDREKGSMIEPTPT